MKVLLMGTGGADGIPALYGNTRVDEYARQHRGKDIRSRSAALIDDILKIDLGPDTLSQVQRHGVDARQWSALFVTHTDDDHLCLSEIQYGLFPFVEFEHLEYTIYGNSMAKSKISSRYPKWPIEFKLLEPFVTVEHQGYRVTPVLANHSQSETCFNFIIEREGKKFLYATDTGYYSEETFRFLENQMIHAMVVECSDGLHKTAYVGHMDLAQCVDLVQRLRTSNGLSENSRVYTTHHTSNGDATHTELISILAPYDIQPGFDGLEINL
jgi:phosphoribosyl 1,2-cyclic phosphate phosphodiesterase